MKSIATTIIDASAFSTTPASPLMLPEMTLAIPPTTACTKAKMRAALRKIHEHTT